MFHRNELSPPLPFGDGSLDCVYAISVLTHLSEKSHFEWVAELRRVIKPRGIIAITTHSDASAARSSETNDNAMLQGGLSSGGRYERARSGTWPISRRRSYGTSYFTNGRYCPMPVLDDAGRVGRATAELTCAGPRRGFVDYRRCSQSDPGSHCPAFSRNTGNRSCMRSGYRRESRFSAPITRN